MTGTKPAHPETLHGVQVLRGFAALGVVIFHGAYAVGSPTLHKMLFNGAAGVDVFFVISGLVMAVTASRMTSGEFLMKRITRIVPIYWLFLTLKIATVATLNVSERSIPLDAGYLIQSYLFIPAYDGDGLVFPPITAGWTLNFEMYFYVICALALLINRARFALITAAIVGVGAVIGTLLIASASSRLPAALYLLSPIALEFVAGLLLGHLWRKRLLPPAWAALILLAGALIVLPLTPPMEQFELMRPLYWGLPAFGIVLAIVALEKPARFARWTPFVLLGDASYALYLSHTATLPVAFKIVSRFVHQPVPALMILVVIAIVVGIFTHLLIEKPLGRMVKYAMESGQRLVPRLGTTGS